IGRFFFNHTPPGVLRISTLTRLGTGSADSAYGHWYNPDKVQNLMIDAFICDAIRTPFGRYAGTLSSIRADDLAAIPITALMQRHSRVDWGALDDVIYGCANQAGEDNRNVARMALLLAGLPKDVPGATVNRLCGSSLEAVAQAAR